MPKRKLNRNAYTKDGVPKYIRLYDNGGKTADRYFCQFTHRKGECFPHLMMSEHPFSPQGVGIHGDAAGNNCQPYDRPSYSHLGKKTRWEFLPPDVQRCIMQDYVEYWGVWTPQTVFTIELTEDDFNDLDRRYAALREAIDRKERRQFVGDREAVDDANEDLRVHALEVVDIISRATDRIFAL